METVTDQVCTVIRQGILSGEYHGGYFLREDKLAQVLGVSLTPVREALRRLGVDGWLEPIPYRGYRVTSWTQEDIHEVFELRALLECHAARRAATRIRPPQLRRLNDIIDEEQVLLKTPGVSHCQQTQPNVEFHEIIMAAAGSRRLSRALECGLHGANYVRSTYGLDQAAMERASYQHRQIQEALALADADLVEALMYTHIMSVARSRPTAEIDAEANCVTTSPSPSY